MSNRSVWLMATLTAAIALTDDSTARAQSLLKVDFGVGATSLQPVFTAVTGAVSESDFATSVGPYSVALSGDGFYSAFNAGNIAETVRPLYRDYYYNNSATPGDGVVLSLGGFEPSTNYDLMLWSYDADNVFSSTPTTWTPFNGTVGPVANITNFAEPPYPNPTTLSQHSATIAITSSPSGTIDVFGTTTGGTGGTRLNAAQVKSNGTDLLSLDFGRPDTPPSSVQSTFVGISGDVGAPQFSQTVGGFTITLNGQGFFQTTSANADSIGAEVRNFFRDYYYNNAIDTGVGVTLEIEGVTPNQDYDLKLWSYDADNFSPTPTVWEPQGATTGTVGNVTNQQDPYPTSVDEYSTTMRIRSTTSTLEIKGSTTGGTGGTRLNGFELLTPSLAADFDSSGAVDGADLTIWSAGFGTGTTKATGDADGDMDVDGADFLIWQRDLAASPPVAAAPEPSAAFTALLGLGALVTQRRRDRDR